MSLIAAAVLVLSTFAANVKTDRTWYLAGEAMRVSVSADDARIAYAELCDTKGLAAGIVISLKEGKATDGRVSGNEGEGVIELPADLHSGYYVLSVYTRADSQVSHRLIAVVNPLRKSKDDDIEWVRINHPDSLSYPHEKGQMEQAWSETKEAEERETDGHIIKARVRNVFDGHTFSGSQIRPSIGIVGKQIHYFEGKMVNDSMAVFLTFGVHGRQPLVLSATSSSGVSLPIEMVSPFAALLPKKLPRLVFHYLRSEVEARSLDMQRHQLAIAPVGDAAEGTEKQAVGVPLDYDDTVFGTKPDLAYNLDEYRQFRTIREVLLEYVLCVEKRKVDGVQKLVVRLEPDHYNNILSSLVLIDGMPVYDTEQLLNYDARRLHYINIYGGQYTFGHDIYNGILSFVTRSGLLTNYPTGRNTQYLVYDFPE